MTPTDEQEQARVIFEQALKLSPAVREVVALELLDSVDDGPPSYTDEEMAALIRQRVEEYHRGAVRSYTKDESNALIRAEVRKLGFELP